MVGSDVDTASATPDALDALMKPDLTSRADIHDLVVAFYREIALDPSLAPIFEEVAEVDWAAHIPVLIDYWCRVLLGQPGYNGNIIDAHRHIHQRQALSAHDFDRWYVLFVSSIDGAHEGPEAERAKAHAAKIARSLARIVSGIEWSPERAAGGVSRK